MENLTVKDLRKLVKLYNLEVHIKGSSKMKKDELKSSLLKHLEINEDGELKHKILTNTYKIEKGELKPVQRKDKKKEEEGDTVLKLIKNYEDLINEINDFKNKSKKYKELNDFEPFKNLLYNYESNLRKKYLKLNLDRKDDKTDDEKKLFKIGEEFDDFIIKTRNYINETKDQLMKNNSREEQMKINEESRRQDEIDMMMKEDVNVKAKPKEITVLELIKMYEDNIEKMKDFRKKANKYKKDEDFKDFEELVKNNDLDSIYRKLMGSGGKFSRTSDKGKLIEIQRKNRDDKTKYKSVIGSLKKELKFNYDDIDTILVRQKDNDYILKELVRLYPKYDGAFGKKEFFTKDEIKKEMKDANEMLKKRDYIKISEYLIKKYPYDKKIFDVEIIIFLFRVYHHYESGKTFNEILERAYSYLFDVIKEENKRRREAERD